MNRSTATFQIVAIFCCSAIISLPIVWEENSASCAEIKIINNTDKIAWIALSTEHSYGSDGLGDSGSVHWTETRGWYEIGSQQARTLSYKGTDLSVYADYAGKALIKVKSASDGEINMHYINRKGVFEFKQTTSDNREKRNVAKSVANIKAKGGVLVPFVSMLNKEKDRGTMYGSLTLNSPTYHKIFFLNRSDKPISAVVVYQDLEGKTATKAWYTMAPGESKHVANTRANSLHYFAEAVGGGVQWGGTVSSYKDEQGKEYGLGEWKITSDVWGPVTMNFDPAPKPALTPPSGGGLF